MFLPQSYEKTTMFPNDFRKNVGRINQGGDTPRLIYAVTEITWCISFTKSFRPTKLLPKTSRQR